MPGWAYGLPAKECKTGGKLQKVPGSVCFDCYAMKGCYVFKVVQDAQYFRLKAIRHPLWTGAMATIINSKKLTKNPTIQPRKGFELNYKENLRNYERFVLAK